MRIETECIAHFEGVEVNKFSLIADNNFQVDVLNFGGIITAIKTPDRDGQFDNVLLNYDDFSDYKVNVGYFGAFVGRHAGRIAAGKFNIDNKDYQVACNREGNNLHGGERGLDKRIWNVEILKDGLKLRYFSPHNEEGFPGNINFEISYRIKAINTLSIEYFARPDQKTLINPTNHASFNLSGGKILASSHFMQINADEYCMVNETGLFSGEIEGVEKTPFDFRIMKKIEADIDNDHPQLKMVNGGYDHPFVLNKKSDFDIKLSDSFSGRTLTIRTDEPAVVVYSGNFLTPGGKINEGNYARKHLGICLETQNIPNAINIDSITNKSLYTPDHPYLSKTEWIFGCK